MIVDGVSRYVVRGRPPSLPPAATEYALLGRQQAYLKNISLRDLVVDENGCFTLTIDPDPAGDRPNHFQTDERAYQLLLRDIVSDPAEQDPIAPAVERLRVPFRQTCRGPHLHRRQ
jgi:hypothetical protein